MRQLATEKLKEWLHSFRVYLVWLQMRWLRHLEYRFNAIANSFGSLFWVGITLLTYNLIFQKVDSLAGWSWNEMLVLFGVYNLWWGLMVTFFNGGLRIGERVRRGGMDKVLLWPGKAFFYVSMKFEPELLVHFLTGVIIFVISLNRVQINLSLFSFILFFVLLLNSLALIYFVSILFGSTAFWFIENRQLADFFWLWETLAKYPGEFFSGSKVLHWAVFTILPVVFIAVIPTEVVLGKIKWGTIGSAFLITFIFAILARKVWRVGLKRYTGVSI